jgi:hypothetical protein
MGLAQYRAAMSVIMVRRARRKFRRGSAALLHLRESHLQPDQFRVIQPVAVDEKIISYFPSMLKGAPEEINLRRLTETYIIYRLAGRVAPDIAAYECNQVGFHARFNEWLVLGAGLIARCANCGAAGRETD